MTWAEVLAVFNFIAWLLPIIIRTWMALKYGNTTDVSLTEDEKANIAYSIKRLKIPRRF